MIPPHSIVYPLYWVKKLTSTDVGEASVNTLNWDGHQVVQFVEADILSEDGLKIVRSSWLPQCLENHGRCRRTSDVAIAASDNLLPSRLVLVEGSSAEKVSARLVITKKLPDSEIGGNFRYLTLSHAWGQQKFFTMNAQNEQECQEKIDMDRPDFNKTFKQAIEITNLLGYRYIWIDSLCIMQKVNETDDLSKRDWEKECGRMGDIYKNSDLNLAASGFEDGAKGLLTDKRKYIVPPTVTIPAITTPTGTKSSRRDYLVFYHEGTLDPSPTWGNWALERRGWVLQENLLVSDGKHILVR